MNILQAFKMAWKSIAGKKGRSALTILSIFIGIAAVMTIVSVMEGMKEEMMKQLERDGLEPPYRVYVFVDVRCGRQRHQPRLFSGSLRLLPEHEGNGRRRDAEQTGKCHRGLRHEEQREHGDQIR